MPTIRRLPEHLVNRIAAGEVVERPASALKEVVENAIDSGARSIAVRLSGGGLDTIEVSDDGCGMAPAEIAMALERHATSKLPEDLVGEEGHIERVSTLGFRGEALPSIASVARLTIESRPDGADEGWRREVDHGTLVADEPAAMPPGTRVRIEKLFAQVPARRKFLRSERAEYAACRDVLRRLAMARPDIGFSLESEGKRVFSVRAGDSLADRVAQIVARELADDGISIDAQRGEARLTGVAGLPTFNRGVADHQYLFVNGRPVKDRLLIGAVRGAYSDMLARDRHAVLALFLDVPPEEVDVNVHPAKTEVRFRDPGFVRGFIVERASPCARSCRGKDRSEPGRSRHGALAVGAGCASIVAGRAFRPRAFGTVGPRQRGGEVVARLRGGTDEQAFCARRGKQCRGRAAHRRLIRLASRGGRSPKPTLSPKPRTGWCWSISTPRTNGW